MWPHKKEESVLARKMPKFPRYPYYVMYERNYTNIITDFPWSLASYLFFFLLHLESFFTDYFLPIYLHIHLINIPFDYNQ